MENWELFLHGCIGALAPEIVRLYNARLKRRKLKFSWYYTVASALYIALGGYVAAIFPGIAAPFWAACIGSSTVLNVNLMGKVGASLFASIMRSPGFAESYRTAKKLGGSPAPAKDIHEIHESTATVWGDDLPAAGTFQAYLNLV